MIYNVKIAIVHDWLITNGGAEKVLKSLVDLFPQADIFSLVDFLSQTERREILKGKKAHTTFIQYLPFAKKHFRNYLPLFPKAIESLDLKKYDLIISSSWAVAKGVKKRSDQLHICYCHTPIRYAWDLYDEYTLDLPQPKKYIVQKTLQYIRKWDIETLERVDCFIANSKFVSERIKRIYQKEAKVIYPPVDIHKFSLWEKKEDYYLTASRLVPYKKTELIIKAFNAMPNKKLVVIGDGEEFYKLKKIAKSNIIMVGYQPDAVLVEKMQKAKAFVYAALEDFGIVPVEALACGTPVIALNAGGTAETVKDGINGITFARQSVEYIVDAVRRFESMSFDAQTVSRTAQKYSIESFQNEIQSFINNKLQEHNR